MVIKKNVHDNFLTKLQKTPIPYVLKNVYRLTRSEIFLYNTFHACYFHDLDHFVCVLKLAVYVFHLEKFIFHIKRIIYGIIT